MEEKNSINITLKVIENDDGVLIGLSSITPMLIGAAKKTGKCRTTKALLRSAKSNMLKTFREGVDAALKQYVENKENA